MSTNRVLDLAHIYLLAYKFGERVIKNDIIISDCLILISQKNIYKN